MVEIDSFDFICAGITVVGISAGAVRVEDVVVIAVGFSLIPTVGERVGEVCFEKEILLLDASLV